MRLGSYEAKLSNNSMIKKIYGKEIIKENRQGMKLILILEKN